MEHGGMAVTDPATDHFPPDLERLSALAAEEIARHTDDHGLCAICGWAWPCERAELAEHNLALL